MDTNDIEDTYFLDTGEEGLVGAYNKAAGKEYANKRTHQQMMDQATFTGFDFENIWQMPQSGQYGYPVLRNVPMIALLEDTVNFAGGMGLAYCPYIVSTPQQLDNIRNFNHKYFILANDIDMSCGYRRRRCILQRRFGMDAD